MTDRILLRYPVYIISKGRSDCCLTARCFVQCGIPFHLVVEPLEAESYAAEFGTECLIIFPFHDLGLGSIPARNFVWEHAKSTGVERHWILDDNIKSFKRRYQGKRLQCDPDIALHACEDFTDRYENIAISGLNYHMNVPDDRKILPLQINCHVYSCLLILNSLSFRWRGRYNEDTDLCLQILSTGKQCTALLNTFLVEKMRTMTMKGGNATTLYQGDGRLKMARSLERMWPGVVTVDRRFHRPHEYGMSLIQVKDEIKSPRLQKLVDEYGKGREV